MGHYYCKSCEQHYSRCKCHEKPKKVETPMTDLEISKALALAIGYAFEDVYYHGPLDIALRDKCVIHVKHDSKWRIFDYRDWAVIGPIAAQYECFPAKSAAFGWKSTIGFHREYADTPQRAIALAVIGAKK
jgi:hypothetical protein